MLDHTTQSPTQAPLEVGRITAPAQYAERVILALDGSQSMTDPAVGKISKGDAVNQACRNLFTRFRVSRVSAVPFPAHGSTTQHGPEKLSSGLILRASSSGSGK
jgi:hypothetical protein